MTKRYTKTTNSFHAWSADDIWQVWTHDATQLHTLAIQIGRSKNAVVGMRSIVKNVLVKNSVDEAYAFLRQKTLSKKTAEAIMETYRLVNLTNHKPPISLSQPLNPVSEKLDNSLQKLDDQFEQLKEVIAEVVSQTVEIKTAEFKKQKEEEFNQLKAQVTSLETVVEAAKKSNLAETLRKRLMGI